MRARATLLIHAMVLFTSGAAGAEEVTYVKATTRLNLRTCPSTRGCSVIQTLAPNTYLRVVGLQDEWLNVKVGSDERLGWVHADYTVKVAVSAPKPQPSIVGSIIRKLAPILLVGGALFGLGYSGRIMRRGVLMRQAMTAVRSDLIKRGKLINESAVSAFERKANSRIWIPSVLWALFYIFCLIIYPPRNLPSLC